MAGCGLLCEICERAGPCAGAAKRIPLVRLRRAALIGQTAFDTGTQFQAQASRHLVAGVIVPAEALCDRAGGATGTVALRQEFPAWSWQFFEVALQ